MSIELIANYCFLSDFGVKRTALIVLNSMFKFLNFLHSDSWKNHPAARYCSEAVGSMRPKSLPTICLPEGIN
jgi:hypothetical protein